MEELIKEALSRLTRMGGDLPAKDSLALQLVAYELGRIHALKDLQSLKESWLKDNKDAYKTVEKGLKDAKENRISDADIEDDT